MATVIYLNSATNETYSESAFGYISTPRILASITQTSDILGISAGAIAGAMAEENNAYDWKDAVLDEYARFNIGAQANLAAFSDALKLTDEQRLFQRMQCETSGRSFRLRVLVSAVEVESEYLIKVGRPWPTSSEKKIAEYNFLGEI